MNTTRGYFGIGIVNGKTHQNMGTLWRSAAILGASFVFTIGKRYTHQATDTMKAYRHTPMYHYDTFEQFLQHLPRECALIGVELDPMAVPIAEFSHPERCAYLLGAEDTGLSDYIRAQCHTLVQLPGEYCLNVSVSGSIVMYDRVSERNLIPA